MSWRLAALLALASTVEGFTSSSSLLPSGRSALKNDALKSMASGLRPQARRSSTLRMAGSDSDAADHRLGRRAALLGMAYTVAGAVVSQVGAETADEEVIRLQNEAKRLNSVFKSQKEAMDTLPGLKKPAPPASDKVAMSNMEAPSPYMSPEDVIKILMQNMKDNERTPGSDTGLKTVLRFTSPRNPISKIPAESFFSEMKYTKYSVLLSDYYTFRILPPVKVVKNPAGDVDEMRQYVVTIEGSRDTFAQCKVPMQCMMPIETTSSGGYKPDSSYQVAVRWTLSKNSETQCWMSDTCELLYNTV